MTSSLHGRWTGTKRFLQSPLCLILTMVVATATAARVGCRRHAATARIIYPHQIFAGRRLLFSTDTKNDRIKDIQMNPDGISANILPGGFVLKQVRDKEPRKVLVERELGNFWMMSDLKKTNNKPILSNRHLIPPDDAQLFPMLDSCSTLDENPTNELTSVPEFCLRNNRAQDVSAQCTLVAIAFKDFGAQMLSSWTKPFSGQFADNRRAEIVHLNITEGWFISTFLKRILTYSARRNTPSEQWSTTLLHYSSTDDPALGSFKDTLRMHNTLTGYVYLLDGLGRVRFAGSGVASKEEAARVIGFAKELTPQLRGNQTKRLEGSRQQRK